MAVADRLIDAKFTQTPPLPLPPATPGAATAIAVTAFTRRAATITVLSVGATLLSLLPAPFMRRRYDCRLLLTPALALLASFIYD